MDTKERTEVPKVFISYSHDSQKHKAWVAELATRLVENGVDVIFDRWELKAGGDVPKFMEKGLAQACRVLMICTEAYVRKADDGKGGVGYEAMIVTAEMVQDLGTTKFIPIIRQSPDRAVLPKCMGARFYVDLSDDANQTESFEELLRELHDEPALKKPPLGKNPFARKPSGEETPTHSAAALITDIAVKEDDPHSTYTRALEIAREGDLFEWRQLVKHVRQPISSGFNEWRNTCKQKPLSNENLPEICRTGVAVYAPMMSMALAGVESGREKFNNQSGILDEILFPKNWNGNGHTVLVRFPDMVAFTYQALHGAVCLETGQISVATDLASMIVSNEGRQDRFRLIQNKNLIGWPDTLEHTCTKAWQFLVELPKHQSWLLDIFGSEEDYHTALCAYYLALNTMELAYLLQQTESELPDMNKYRFDVPLVCHSLPNDVQRRAYRLLPQQPEKVCEIWRKLGVADRAMAAAWPSWIQEGHAWLGNVYQFGLSRHELAHERLMEDLNIITSPEQRTIQ